MNGNGKKEEIQLRLFKIGCWGIYLYPGVMKLQWIGGGGTLRTFVICIVCKYYCGDHFKKKSCVGAWKVWGWGIYRFWWGNL